MIAVMTRFLGFLLRVVLTTLLLVACTRFASGGQSVSTLLGFPVVSVKGSGAAGVIAMGQSATGVLVLAQVGVGVIIFAQAGIGVLFGIGQAMTGLITIAQVGFGVFFFFGQLGPGLVCVGQVVCGWMGAGQLPIAILRGRERLEALSEEVSEALAPWPRRRVKAA